MKESIYKLKESLYKIILAVMLILPSAIGLAQEKGEEERMGKIAQEYYQQNILGQTNGGDNSEAIKERFFTGAAANDWFGWSVSTAGDVNGDGYADVIVGANGNDAGRAYIYFGGAAMNNTADVTLTGAAANDWFGWSVSTAGDVNGDGYADVIVGTYGNDAGGISAGRAYLYLSSAPPAKPRIMSVKDVPFDQGGFVNLKWVRSSYDVNAIERITGYVVERSLPPGIGGFAWEQIANITTRKNPYYLYTASTWNDSTTNNSGTVFYRVTAVTSNGSEYWRSNIMSGHSVDNLSPSQVKNFNAAIQGINNKLSWKANTEADLKNYHIYRALTPTIDPDTMTAFLVTTDTTGLDTSLPPGDMYYFIRARDIHDNFGPLAQIITPLPLRQINLSALIEGFYDNISNTMVEDTVTVLLRNISSPYALVDQSKVKLNTSGNGLVKFRNAANGANYYLVIQHRNSIETWSKLAQQFTNSEMIYDFTDAASKAYGDNQKLKGSKWTIYSGDVNQDGIIDLSDEVAIINDILSFAVGSLVTDLNGDAQIDLSDIVIAVNNTLAFVIKQTPETLLMKREGREKRVSKE